MTDIDEAVKRLTETVAGTINFCTVQPDDIRTVLAELERLKRGWDEAFKIGVAAQDAERAAEAEAARLREALNEARDNIAVWGSYAGAFFQDKYDLAGDLAKIDAALEPHQ